ncbi:hypothetical protein HPB50_025401 [Hyalomma asiaticum]|uniref:Uncharacterized protein n=1 Tax=Hyalomma asiaticum TaxID=266040 RepID=A0ACB7TT75_HYAAI|nr:hypothetical protein HPB50_025401 [Hyalomma asiaticum]
MENKKRPHQALSLKRSFKFSRGLVEDGGGKMEVEKKWEKKKTSAETDNGLCVECEFFYQQTHIGTKGTGESTVNGHQKLWRVSAEVWSELAEFPGAIDGSAFEEFVSADDDVAIMGQLQDKDYVADVMPTTSQSDCNEEIDDGPLPTSSEVISALALVRRYCVNMEGCGLSCSDSLDNVEACVLSQAAKSLKQKKIQDYFVPK